MDSLPPVSPSSILSTSASSSTDTAPSSVHSLRDQLVALKTELRRSRAQTAALETKLATVSRSQPAPFGSSTPTTGTHAAQANGAGHGKSTTVVQNGGFGHLRTNGTTPQPPTGGSGRHRIPERPHTALGVRRHRSPSPPPPTSPLPPLPPTFESPRPSVRQVSLGTPTTRQITPHSSTSPHQASLSQIPVAVVGSKRALAGHRSSPSSSPRLDQEATLPSLRNGSHEASEEVLLPSHLPPRAPSPVRTASKTSTSHNPFYGGSSGQFTQDRHAARVASSTTGTGRVIDNLQAELAAVRGAHEECKAQLRLSQRAVEHLGRQNADLVEAKERSRLETETLTARLARKERLLEEVLVRARTAEASLTGAHAAKAEAVKRAKELEAKTEDAVVRMARAEAEYDALRSGVRGVRAMWGKEVDGLKAELEACRAKHDKELAAAKEAQSQFAQVSSEREASAREIRQAVVAMQSSQAAFAAECSSQLAELANDVRRSALAGDDSLRQAGDVAAELKRMRRMMRDHAQAV